MDQTPDADLWWTYVVDFLRAEGAATAPPADEAFAIEVMPVFVAVDKAIRLTWPSPPEPLHWGSWLKRVVRSEYKQYGYIWLSGGPLRYGLVKIDGRLGVAAGCCDWF